MTAKYAFIDTTETELPGYFGARRMCRWLGVSPSGFFVWRTRPVSARARRREDLVALVRWSFDRSGGTYGYRRVHADLCRRAIPVGADLVRDIMAAQQLVAGQPRPRRRTTLPGDPAGPADLVGRDFTATEPGARLVGDIPPQAGGAPTYIPTWAGFAYLATVIDCYSKQVIGWAVAEHMRTDLVTDALDMARGNHRLTEGAIFHSDRGTQCGFNCRRWSEVPFASSHEATPAGR